MLPKVLCLFGIVALVAAAPYSDRQYIDQLQKEYQDDQYDSTSEDYGVFDGMQQQFEKANGQNLELKDIEQFETEGDKQHDGIEQINDREDIEQTDDREQEDIEQTDDREQEDIEQTDDKEQEDIEQIDDRKNIEQIDDREDIEQGQRGSGEEMQDIEQVDQDPEYQPEKIEQVQQTDDYWKQNHDSNDNDGDDKIHFPEDMDQLETDSAIGKLFGKSTVQEQEAKYDDDQDQQQTEVNFDEDKLPEEEVISSPSYKPNYGSGHSGAYKPLYPYEPEVTTKKPSWYKRLWASTKEKARNLAHKVKETVGRK